MQGAYRSSDRVINGLRLQDRDPGYGAEVTGVTLEEWLNSTQDRRDELDAFARSALPLGADVHGETNKLIECEDDANRLRADAESFLTQYTAQAVLSVRGKYPDSSADERKIHVKDEVRQIQRLVDGISVTARTISSRRFLMMNAARSR